MERSCRIAALVFLASFAAASSAEAQVPVRGTLLGADGRPMPRAHVVVEDGPADVRLVAEADEEGRFSFELPEPGGYGMYLMGVHHETLETPLVVIGREPVDLTVRLATPDYRDPPDTVRVVGSFKGFDQQGPILMKKQPDSTFAAQVEAAADTLMYQLTGVRRRGTLPGPQASRYFFNRKGPFWDDRSDYFSVVDDAAASTRITFDPSALPRSAAEPVVRSSNATVEGVATIYLDVEERERRIGGRRNAPALQQPIRQRIEAEQNPLLRQWLLLRYFDELNPPPGDSLLARRALEEVPPASPFWSYEAWGRTGASNLIFSVARRAHQPDRVAAYVQRAIEEHPDPDVRRHFLYRGVSMADDEGREEQKMEYYGRLMNEFGDSWHAERARRQFAPKRAIQAGRPIPDFTLPAMDDTSTVYTDEGLRGTTYLIDVWAVWCAPCIAEMDELHAAHEKYQDDGLRILSISLDYERQDVQAFRAERWPMPWKHIFAGFSGEKRSEVEERFEVVGIPRPILVGADGTILATGGALRGEKLDQTLARLFEGK